MCNKAIDDCLAPLKFVSDWFFTSKMIKMICTQMKIYSTLIKVLVMLYLIIMKRVFLI